MAYCTSCHSTAICATAVCSVWIFSALLSIPCLSCLLMVFFGCHQGNLQEALAQYQELEREDPTDFRPYLCQGLVYTLLDQKAEAERAFRKYRRRCPKSFPERGYLDDLMIGAKTEARKIQVGERLQPKGKKKSKPLKQPNVMTAVAEKFEE